MMSAWLEAAAVVFGTFTTAIGLILVTDDHRRLLERAYGLWLIVIGFLCAVSNAVEFWAH